MCTSEIHEVIVGGREKESLEGWKRGDGHVGIVGVLLESGVIVSYFDGMWGEYFGDE